MRLVRELRLMFDPQTLRRVWKAMGEDDIPGIAAEVSFYALFALFPFLLFVGALVGMVVPDPAVAMGRLLVVLHDFLPTTAAALLGQFLEGPLRANRPYLLSLGVLGILWAGSQGFAAILKALSRIYCVRERRSWIRQRALSLAMTMGLALVSLVVLVVMTGFESGGILSSRYAIPNGFTAVWTFLRWPALFLILSAVLTRFYATVPCVRQPRLITPGGLVASLLWIVASTWLPAYLDGSESYARLYGPIGDVMVLMLWFYLGVCAILLGAEINTAILRRPSTHRSRHIRRGARTPERLEHVAHSHM